MSSIISGLMRSDPMRTTSSSINTLGLIVSIVCLFIGVICAAFDANTQGWHDKIAGTYVIRT